MDPDGDVLSFSWAPGALFDDSTSPTPTGTFPLGTTEVILTVSDDLQSDSDTVFVTIEDTTPPEISIVWNRYFLWPPNLRMVDIMPRWFRVTDICCEPQWVLESVTSNEPDDGLLRDIAGADTGTTDTQFRLRADRSASECGCPHGSRGLPSTTSWW